MARYPIKFLKDHNGQYFFPFMTEDAIFLNESDKTLKDVIDEAEAATTAAITAGDYAEYEGDAAKTVVDEFYDILGDIETEVNKKSNKTDTGNNILMTLDSSTYVLTLQLRTNENVVLNTQTVDLPLESVVVDGYYDNINKKIVLELESGSYVDIPVGDLINGLQSEITNNNKLSSDLVDDTNSTNKFVSTSEKSTWNGKYDKPLAGIPKTDLTDDVQTSLGKADTALQEHQDLSDYVKNTDYMTNQKGGVAKSDSVNYGFNVSNAGYLYLETLNFQNYNTKGQQYAISKGTLENVIEGKGLVSNTDIAGYNKKGVIMLDVDYNGLTTDTYGNLTPTSIDYRTYQSKGSYYTISKGTLENVLNVRIGDIATALDTLNGEVI